jgi:hypothetical protein
MDATATKSRSYNSFNSTDLREVQSSNYHLELQLSSLWRKSIYNAELGLELTAQNNFLPKNNTNTQNKNYMLFFNSFFELKNGIYLKIYSENYLAQTTGMTDNYFSVLHFNVGLPIFKEKMFFELSGNNILNTKSYRLSYSSDIFNSAQSFQLLPRFILASLKFKF